MMVCCYTSTFGIANAMPSPFYYFNRNVFRYKEVLILPINHRDAIFQVQINATFRVFSTLQSQVLFKAIVLLIYDYTEEMLQIAARVTVCLTVKWPGARDQRTAGMC